GASIRRHFRWMTPPLHRHRRGRRPAALAQPERSRHVLRRATGPRARRRMAPMATLKEFEEALREHGMNMALALLERLRERDRATRTVKPARRLTGQKMTPELA